MEKKANPKLIFFLLLFCLWLYVPTNMGGGGDMLTKLMDGIGFHDFRDFDRVFITVFVALFCVVFAYVADYLLGAMSFGLFVIYPVCVLFIGGSLATHAHFYGQFSVADTVTIIFLILLPSFAAVLFLAVMRKISTAVVDVTISSGRTKMHIPTARELGEHGPTKDRLRTATRERR